MNHDMCMINIHKIPPSLRDTVNLDIFAAGYFRGPGSKGIFAAGYFRGSRPS